MAPADKKCSWKIGFGLNLVNLQKTKATQKPNQMKIKPSHDQLLIPEAYVLSFSLLVFSCPVVSDSLWPHGLQHARPPCPSPWVCPSSCSLHRCCHPAISSSNALFSFRPQSFPASGTVPRSHLFASDDQNTRASASVFPVNIQGWAPLVLTGLISLSKRQFQFITS